MLHAVASCRIGAYGLGEQAVSCFWLSRAVVANCSMARSRSKRRRQRFGTVFAKGHGNAAPALAALPHQVPGYGVWLFVPVRNA